MISKKLLSEVLGLEVKAIVATTDNDVKYSKFGNLLHNKPKQVNINIHELAHKCKEWATKQKSVDESVGVSMYLKSDTRGSIYNFCEIWLTSLGAHYLYIEDEFVATTESEAIFRACEWILEQKNEV